MKYLACFLLGAVAGLAALYGYVLYKTTGDAIDWEDAKTAAFVDYAALAQ